LADNRSTIPQPELDRQIQRRAEEVLRIHPHFHGHSDWVYCRCRRGCLRLEGRLPSWYLKQLAQEAMKGIPGVQRLSNRIEVASPTGHVQPPWSSAPQLVPGPPDEQRSPQSSSPGASHRILYA
jgi:hypothetical protein